MKLRSYTSMALLIISVVSATTGIGMLLVETDSVLLYFEEFHEWFGFSLIAFVVIHIVINIKPMKNYMKGKTLPVSKELLVNGLCAIVLSVVLIGSVSSIAKTAASSPYPTVENMALEAVLENTGITMDEAMAYLINSGYVVPDGKLTLKTLSQPNKQSPKELYYEIISIK